MSHYYEIKIRFNGAEFHTSMQTAEGDQFRFVADAAWPALCATINADALATIDAQTQEVASLAAALAALKATAAQAAQAVVAVVNDESISDAQTAAACKQIALQVLKPVRDREIEAAELDEAKDAAALAASSARVAALRAL